MNPSAVAADPTDDECPGREATVQTWSCAACGLHWAATAVNPALSVVGLLPTPQLRTAAFLAVLRTEVERLGKGVGTMTVILCLPATRRPAGSTASLASRCATTTQPEDRTK